MNSIFLICAFRQISGKILRLGMLASFTFAGFLHIDSASAAVITYLDRYQNNTNGVTGLSGISDVAVSVDGKYVYTASYMSSTVAIFQRNQNTGLLAFNAAQTGVNTAFSVATSSDNKSVYAASPSGFIYAFSRDIATGALTQVSMSNSTSTSGFVSVSVSADGKWVYGVGGSPSGLVVFQRNSNTSALTLVQDLPDNLNGNFLGQGFGPTISPIKNITTSADGQRLYVTSTADNAVSLYDVNPTNGTLTLVQAVIDGTAGADGLQGASSLVLSPDGDHLYVSGQGESAIGIFAVNAINGQLTYLTKIAQGTAGITTLSGVRSLAISPDGRYLYASAITSNAVSVFDRNSTTGLLAFNTAAINNVNGVTGLAGPSGMSTDRQSRHLYVAGQSAQSLVAFALPVPSLELSTGQATAPFNASASVVDSQLEVFDADSPNLASATVAITSGLVTTDQLSVQTQGGVTAAYNAVTGVLTLTGNASLADYRAVLRTLSYQSGADPSVAAGGFSSRTLTLTVSDGVNTSAQATLIITVGPAPTVGPPVVVTPAVQSIPTLSEWGLILMSSLIMVLAMLRMRNRALTT